jgi:transposase
MMGKQPVNEPKLFYYDLSLEERIPHDHLLRRIRALIDFDFVYEQVEDRYGVNGNVSVPPPVVIKLMLLLFLYDVRSERELIRSLSYRLDWLWFCDYDFDSDIPHHSILSKARKRWGLDVFETLFARAVAQCVAAGLVNGRTIHIDGSLVDANASNNSVIKGGETLVEQLKKQLQSELTKLDEPLEPASKDSSEDDSDRPTGPKKYYKPKNKGMVSTTDPDAAIVRKGRHGPKARYKTHRVVDDQCGIITATETTSGDVEENSKLMSLVDQHERNTHSKVDTVVADNQYGTADNFRRCHERGIRSHMGDLLAPQLNKGAREAIYGYDDFVYHPETDTYTCPAGQTLTRRKHKKTRQAYEYACRGSICRDCSLRSECTKAQGGVARTIKRHYNQEAIDLARQQSHSPAAKRDRIRRRWLMEGSFGDATTQHGFKRSRWRGLWRQRIQDYLIATVQNLRKLVQYTHRRTKRVASMRVIFCINEKLLSSLMVSYEYVELFCGNLLWNLSNHSMDIGNDPPH